MMLGLKTTLATFPQIIIEVFGKFITKFIFLHEFGVYSTRREHLRHLCLCLERCRATRLSLNPINCAFSVTSGAVLGHIVCSDDIMVNPGKIKAIIDATTLKNAKALSHFLGQIRWHSRMLRHLADLTTTLHATCLWLGGEPKIGSTPLPRGCYPYRCTGRLGVSWTVLRQRRN